MFYVCLLITIFTSIARLQAEVTEYNTMPEFVILMTGYNIEKYVEESLKSVCFQKSSRPYQVICINDCSTDNTRAIMDRYVQENHLESFVKPIHNSARIGSLENIYNAIHTLIPDHKIVVSVDADDQLIHNDVLLRLEKEYSNPHVWMTYGNALTVPGGGLWCKKVSDKALLKKQLRREPFLAQHLKTFKAGLFKKIRKEDLMYQGKFLTATGDMAFMFPMLEMCAPKDWDFSKNHSRFISEPLYLYRMDNPINVFRVNKDRQKFFDQYIRSKSPYKRLEKLN